MPNTILEILLSEFDFGYCVTVNILTYLIIRVIDDNRTKNLTTWQKRIVLLVAIAIISIGYYLVGTDLKVLINSSILAPVSWSWIFKPICKYFKIDYKKFDIIK